MFAIGLFDEPQSLGPIDYEPHWAEAQTVAEQSLVVLRNERGTLPLSQLASLEFEKAPTLVQRFNRERAMTIDADARGGYNIKELTQAITRQLDQMDWPRGYHYSLGGESEASAQAFGGIGIAIVVAIFGIFAILVLEFGNRLFA